MDAVSPRRRGIDLLQHTRCRLMDLDDTARTRRTPLDMDPDAFAAAGHRLVDDIAGLLESMRTRRLGPTEGPSGIRDVLAADRALPESGMDPGDLLRDAVDLLVPYSLYNGHPRFFGYITGAPAPVGMLGDFLAS